MIRLWLNNSVCYCDGSNDDGVSGGINSNSAVMIVTIEMKMMIVAMQW